MWRIILACVFIISLNGAAAAQLRPERGTAEASMQWRAPKKGLSKETQPKSLREARETSSVKVIPSAARATSGDGRLPADQGQIWREYDIRPYTSKVTTTEKPEQAVVDWVLRETGTDIWFTGAVGLLNADRDTLRVYHTPEVQRQVADVVDRFVLSQAETYSLGLKLVTIGNPNWRTKYHTLLRSVTVQSPGVEAWLLSKEHAGFLATELAKRTDYRELNAPSIAIQNGQSQTVAQTKLRSYIRGVRMKAEFPFYDTENGQIDEGYSLEVSPLMAADNSAIDLVLKCHVDQLEKLVPVTLEIPQGQAAPARVAIQVPQVVSWRMHERFRWPSDQVLVLSCGVVATPTGEKTSPLGIPGLGGGPARADALLFIESHGKIGTALGDPTKPAAATSADASISRGRY